LNLFLSQAYDGVEKGCREGTDSRQTKDGEHLDEWLNSLSPTFYSGLLSFSIQSGVSVLLYRQHKAMIAQENG
jgi:hypothetical protein